MARKFRDFVLRNEKSLIELYETGNPKYARYLELIKLAKEAFTIYCRNDKNRTKATSNPFSLLIYKASREKAFKHELIGPLFKKYVAEISRVGYCGRLNWENNKAKQRQAPIEDSTSSKYKKQWVPHAFYFI